MAATILVGTGRCAGDEAPATISDFCKNKVVSEVVSPDQQWKAVIFERHCGSIGHDTTDVSIIRASATLKNEPGNAFAVAGTEPPAGWAAIDVEWINPSQLTITYNRNVVVCFAARFAADVILNYKLAPRP